MDDFAYVKHEITISKGLLKFCIWQSFQNTLLFLYLNKHNIFHDLFFVASFTCVNLIKSVLSFESLIVIKPSAPQVVIKDA